MNEERILIRFDRNANDWCIRDLRYRDGIEPMHAPTMRSPRILHEPRLHYFVITVAITSALPQPSSRRQDEPAPCLTDAQTPPLPSV